MKKYIALFIALSLALATCACGTDVQPNHSKDTGSEYVSEEISEESTALSTEEVSTEDIKKLPLKFGGFPYGSVIYTADVAAFNASNPWSGELQLTEMPVVEKSSLLNSYEIKKLINTLASVLNLTESLPMGDYGSSWTGTYKEGVVITVDKTGYVQLLYTNGGKPLPTGYSFDATSRNAAVERLGWLTDNYAGLFDIEKAVQCVEPYYNEQGNLSYSALSLTGGMGFVNTFLYPKGETAAEDILNYFLYPVRFTESVTADSAYNITPNGTLGGVYAYIPTTSLVNEYPIISVEEAKALLLNKKCYCPSALNLDLLIKEESIGKAELVYNRDDEGGVCMPFYRFLLKSPDEEYCYYSCYVPAVEERYLDTSAIPNWS